MESISKMELARRIGTEFYLLQNCFQNKLIPNHLFRLIPRELKLLKPVRGCPLKYEYDVEGIRGWYQNYVLTQGKRKERGQNQLMPLTLRISKIVYDKLKIEAGENGYRSMSRYVRQILSQRVKE